MNLIESDLAALRWPAANADLDALLSRIGSFGHYLLVLIDGKLATAPDDRHRRLAAVFTSDAARNEYLNELPDAVKTALNQKVTLTCNGHDSFIRLAAMPLDGIVFNCLGPERPIAFVPALSNQVLQRIDLESSTAAEPAPAALAPASTAMSNNAAYDFDMLTAAAFPGQQVGPIAAVNALWRAAFALDQWLFIMHPAAVSDPQPFVANEAGYACMFAFTDGERLRGFAKENDLVAEKGSALMLGISPHNAIEWGREELERGGSQRVHFNFGGPGWFAPMARLPDIYDFVQGSAD